MPETPQEKPEFDRGQFIEGLRERVTAGAAEESLVRNPHDGKIYKLALTELAIEWVRDQLMQYPGYVEEILGAIAEYLKRTNAEQADDDESYEAEKIWRIVALQGLVRALVQSAAKTSATPAPKRPTLEAVTEALPSQGALEEEFRRALVVDERVSPPENPLYRNPDNGLFYKRVGNQPTLKNGFWLVVQHLNAAKCPDARTLVVNALHTYFQKLEAAVRATLASDDPERGLRLILGALHVEQVEFLTMLLEHTGIDHQKRGPASDEDLRGQGDGVVETGVGAVRGGLYPVDGSTGLGDTSDAFHGDAQAGPPHDPNDPPQCI